MAKMTDVKFVQRGISAGVAVADPSQPILTAPTLEKYLKETYLDKGYEIKEVFNLGVMKDQRGFDAIQVLFLLVKYE